MKYADLMAKSEAELRTEEEALRKQLMDLNFQHGLRQLSDTAAIGRTKRDIARVATAISAKQRQAEA